MKTKRLAALVLCLAILIALLPNMELTAYAEVASETTPAQTPRPTPRPTPESNKGSNTQEEWLKYNDLWYFVNTRGKLQTGWLETSPNRQDRYYFNSNCAMQTGWVKIDGHWYFFSPSGALKTGWLQQGSVWYYLWGNGAMATGTQTIDEQVSSFDSSGAWLGYK